MKMCRWNCHHFCCDWHIIESERYTEQDLEEVDGFAFLQMLVSERTLFCPPKHKAAGVYIVPVIEPLYSTLCLSSPFSYPPHRIFILYFGAPLDSYYWN
jgi:hypothetical protein